MRPGRPGKGVVRAVVFTDLDGTLLDARTYSFEAALPALENLRDRHIPLVVCSSKTRAEIEHYRVMLGNGDPFISENGGAVFVPRGYFSGNAGSWVNPEEDEGHSHFVLRLGARYEELRRAIGELREEGFDVRGFGDMTAREIAAATGLSLNEAVMAAEREFDEPFLFSGDEAARESLVRCVTGKGFNITRGLFYHLMGESDKGRAVSILIEMFRKEYGQILTVALGDSPNDLPMLQCVEHPVIVEKHGGGYDPVLAGQNFRRAQGAGPEGWNGAVMDILAKNDQ